MHQLFGNALMGVIVTVFNALLLLFRQFGGWLIGLIVVNALTGWGKTRTRSSSRRSGYYRHRSRRSGRRRR